ncbi:methylated-DNA--[protein]-cysteine S-methyltransferase [Micrococcus lylae]|uniref:methylated-DNA--[protein]-cysteine S-methyltransferase n=1 Tax=Micrococcus lylae TaxID=1273 RepID=UPI003EC02B6A
MTAFDDYLPELRWTAAALPDTELNLVAVFSPEDQTVRASGVAVPAGDEPHAAAIGRLLLELMDRLEEVALATAAREMNPMPVEPHPRLEQPVADSLAAYAGGDVGALDGLAVEQPGTAFRRTAWDGLRRIPAGAPLSYSRFAEAIGRPTAVRAAGTACAKNLVAVVVPCHRVVRADGSVGSYLYGAEAKRALLEHEAKHAR